MTPEERDRHPGWLDAVRMFARNIVALACNRLELAAIELSDLSGNVARFLMLAALMLVLIWFAIASWVVLLAFLAWEVMGWQVILLFGAVFSCLSVAITWYLVRYMRSGKLSMPLTVEALQQDRDALSGES